MSHVNRLELLKSSYFWLKGRKTTRLHFIIDTLFTPVLGNQAFHVEEKLKIPVTGAVFAPGSLRLYNVSSFLEEAAFNLSF